MRRLLPVLLVVGLASVAYGQESDAERIRELEARLAELTERLERAEQDLMWQRRVLGLPATSPTGDVDPFSLVPARPGPVEVAPAPEVDPEVDPPPSSGKWLRFNQERDGSWASPQNDHDVAVTSLALLAFLGSGHTHRFGAFKRTVGKALKWLKGRQGPNGFFDFSPQVPLSQFDLALGTMALCEAYAVSRDFTLKRYAKKSVGALRSLQTAGGGWSFAGPRSPVNSLATAYGVLALKAARAAGFEVPDALFTAAADSLVAVTDARGRVGLYAVGDGVSVSLGDPAKARADPLFTAAAVVSRIFCGDCRSNAGLRAGADSLTPLGARFDPAYGYFATYAMFQMGGDRWKAWGATAKAALRSSQVTGPDHVGSWEPTGIWGAIGGRAAVTAVNALTLEIYARYERAQRR